MNESNKAQIELWNGRVGDAWSKMQISLDKMLMHVTDHLKDRVGSVKGKRVLDIGCGTGETCTLWLQDGATVTGVDVSESMLALAKKRTQGKAKLIHADASIWKGETPFDLAVSRFGVMFFSDPHAAFKQIASNIRPQGRIVFACWRSIQDNPWVTTPMSAVKHLLPELPPTPPEAPGPFALADQVRLTDILKSAGFKGISITPFDIPVYFSYEGGIDAAVDLAMQIGPTASALKEASEEARTQAPELLKKVLAPFKKQNHVALDGAIWIVEATTA